MAILERWGRPARDYYSWQCPCGTGWLLELIENQNGSSHDGKIQRAEFPCPELRVVKTVSFTN